MNKLSPRGELFPLKNALPSYEPLYSTLNKPIPDFSRYTSRKYMDKVRSKSPVPDLMDYNKIYAGERTLSQY